MAKFARPVYQGPALGFVRLERQLPPDHLIEVRIPARENGLGDPTGGAPRAIRLRPGEAIGPMLWSDCQHIISNPPATCVYAPEDKDNSTDEIPAYLVWRPNDRLLEGVMIGNSPEAWIRAYSGEEPPPPMSTMRTIGQTMNTRKAPGASFPAFETFAAWDTTDKRLFAKLVRDSRVCVVTREPGSEDTIEYKCKEAVAKVCFEKVKKSFTVPPETVDQWELPHIEVFWQALMAEDTSLGKYRTGK